MRCEPLPLTARPRLLEPIEVAGRVSRYGEPIYVLRHPAGATYLELDAVDYEVAGWMDGDATLVDLAGKFFLQHRQLAIHRIRRLAQVLDEAGLLDGSKEALAERSNPPRAWDLGPFIEGVHQRLRWVSSPPGIILLGAQALLGGIALLTGMLFGNGPSLWLVDSVTAGTLLALVAIPIVALVHELGHGVATRAAGRTIGVAGIDIGHGRVGLYVDTSDILMASTRARVAVALAGSGTGVSLGGLLALVALLLGPPLASALSLVAYLCYLLNLMNLLPVAQFDGRRALVWLLESPEPLHQAWREIREGLRGTLPRRLVLQSAAVLAGTVSIVLGLALLLIWAFGSVAVELVRGSTQL